MTLLLPVEPLAGGESLEATSCGGRAPRTMGLTAGGRILGLACIGSMQTLSSVFSPEKLPPQIHR